MCVCVVCCLLFVVCCLLLFVVCWLLVVGCWLLVVVCWLLVGPSSLVSPKLTRPTLFYVHCVPQEGGRMQGWEGCRGGNRYVEGDLLTFGYLMLDDSLGFP